MALAWLNLVGIDGGALRFAIDTGSSRYYQLKVGRGRTRREGFDWVDDVYLSTPMRSNEAGGSLLAATREVSIPASRLDRGAAYVQLVSFKAPDGRGPAFSQVIPLPSGAQALDGRIDNVVPPLSVSAPMSVAQAFQTPRQIPCVHSPDEYARETSLDDLLAGLVKVAAPAVLQMLGDGKTSGSAGTAGSPPAEASPVTGVISFLLKTLLSGIQAPAAGSGAPAEKPTLEKSKSQSLGGGRLVENRFTAARRADWSQPFIFGIDDALIGTLLGPVLNVLPQLVNSANQGRLQIRQADNKLVTDSLSEVNKRMLMEQIVAAQAKASGEQQTEIENLKKLLQAALEEKSQAKSLSLAVLPAPTSSPSKRAVLSFATAEPLAFNGTPRLLFVRDRDIELKVRFTVGAPVPRAPLPKAILTATFKGSHNPTDWVTTTAKLENVEANGVLTIAIPKADLARLPANRKVPVVAELRWRGARGAVYSATGATDIVLVDRYFVRERGAASGEERELTDMGRFRAFWNKVWEAPPLDSINRSSGGSKKLLWELDVNTRYLVLLSAHQQANGVMETKLATVAPDSDSVSARVDGRLKAGIELSMNELNKLATLWPGQSSLDTAHLAALQSEAVARSNAGEFISTLKLKGRAGERGMVWVIPVFRLVDFTMSSVQKTDDAGQVVAVGEEKVRFPLPVAARVIGLKSAASDSDHDADPTEYSFDGYSIEVSQKVALTPIARRGHEG